MRCARRTARLLLIAGAAGTIAAGIVQAALGAHLSPWTGDKADPGRLGALTVVLGGAALVATPWLTAAARRGAGRVAAGTVVALAAVIGFTTVGRLWYLPGPLLAAGLAASI